MMTSWFRTLGEAAGVILTALLLAGAVYLARPVLRPLVASTPPAQPETAGIPETAIRFIALEDARVEFRTGTALFADARPLRAYNSGHIQGAMHLDPNEFDTWSESFFSQIPADTLIIAYCAGAQCPLSSELAEKLNLLGYEKVFVLKDGWSLWNTAQLPTEQVAE